MQSLQAVAEEISMHGNQLIVHATELDQAKEAIRLGAKVLVHSVMTRWWIMSFFNLPRIQV